MKERLNPTKEQALRRLRRSPSNIKDQRRKNDAYWALRLQGFPNSVAKRAFRDELPLYAWQERETSGEYIDDLDPSEILFPESIHFSSLEVVMRPELTEETVEQAQPRDSEYTIWHGYLPGFGLRIRPTGYKCYILMYRIEGTPKQGRLTIGRPSLISLEQATLIAREMRILAMAGLDPKKPNKGKGES